MKNKFTRSIYLLLFVGILALFVSCHSSRKSIGIEEGWELLSEQKVNFVRDRDDITIKSRNELSALRFRVEDRDVHISDMKVYFQNGDKLEPNINDDIKAGENSRLIELGREGRYIDHIEFKYRTVGNILKGRANILLLGKRAYRNR